MRIIALVGLLMCGYHTVYASPLSDIALDLFTHEGSILIKLMLVGVVGSLLVKLTGAAGEGQISGMIKVAGIFLAIYLVTSIAWKAVVSVAQIAGLV